jgi:hypothetical protein
MRPTAAAFFFFFTLACSTRPADVTAPSHAVAAGPGVSRYFPLEEGRIYHYVTNDNGETGMLVAKVHRDGPTRGELRLSNSTKRFVLSDDGVAYDGGAFLLKAPIEVGATWPGEHGGTTRITSVDASPKVAAGSYSGCVETVEEGGRVPAARYTTTYCPGVGMVLLKVKAPGGDARAELKSYGFPIKIE